MDSTREMDVSEGSGCSGTRLLAKLFENLADDIDKHQKRLDSANLNFSTNGALGGTLTIIGLCLIPVSFGASTALSVAGGVIGGISAIGSFATSCVDYIVSCNAMKQAQQQLNIGAKEIKNIRVQLPELISMLNDTDKNYARKQIENSSDISKEVKEYLNNMLKKYEFDPQVGSFVDSASDVVKKLIDLTVVLSKYSVATQVLTGIATGVAIYGAKAGAAGAAAATAADVGADVASKAVSAGRAAATAADVGADVASKAVSAGRAAATAADVGADVANKAVSVGRVAGTAADVGADVAKTAGRSSLNGARVFGVAAAGAGLAIDLSSIVYYSIKVYKQEPCELAKAFRRVANCLK